MKNKSHFMFALYFFMLCFIVFTGCTADTNVTSISIPVTRPAFTSIADVPTPNIFPSFILEVSPMPSAIISFELFIKASNPQNSFFIWYGNEGTSGYDGSVCVKYNFTPLLVGLPERSIKRTTMLIDDEIASPFWAFSTDMLCEHVSENGTTTPWDCNEHAACWVSSRKIGVHKATFQTHFNSGEIREYTWYFEIVEPTVTPTP